MISLSQVYDFMMMSLISYMVTTVLKYVNNRISTETAHVHVHI